MKFKKDYLLDVLWEDQGTIVEDKIIEHSRWSVIHSLVFKTDDGKYYLTDYRVGATESQDESPWEYEGDEIECTEVVPVDKVITEYVTR